MKRTDNMDTTPRAQKAFVEMLRAKDAAWRLRRALELSDEMRRMFPDQTKRSVLQSLNRKLS